MGHPSRRRDLTPAGTFVAVPGPDRGFQILVSLVPFFLSLELAPWWHISKRHDTSIPLGFLSAEYSFKTYQWVCTIQSCYQI